MMKDELLWMLLQERRREAAAAARERIGNGDRALRSEVARTRRRVVTGRPALGSPAPSPAHRP